MENKRKVYYESVLIDNNKEKDYISTAISKMDFKRYINYVVPHEEEGRLDLISFVNYGTVDLWWLIAQVNDITNPFTEVVTGTSLKIPTITEYFTFYNENAKTDAITNVFDTRKIV